MFEVLFWYVIVFICCGCYKIVLECVKLCFGLDYIDSKGMLYMILYFVFRSGEEEWLFRFVEDFGYKCWVGGKWELYGSLFNFLDFVYSKVMVLYIIVDDIKVVDVELLKAMFIYSYVFIVIFMCFEVVVLSDKDWKEIFVYEYFDFFNCVFDFRSFEYVSDIFVIRYYLFWRLDFILYWVKCVVCSVIQFVDFMKFLDMIDGLMVVEFVMIFF